MDKQLGRCLVLGALCLVGLGWAEEPRVGVRDSGLTSHPAQWECTRGHKVETRNFVLESPAARYGLAYSGCVDPSHGEERPSAEGNFGMPEPTRCNFYSGGFIGVTINGKDAIRYRVADLQVVETGSRGAVQAIFAHPDATVGLRLVLLPQSNHLLCQVSWKPKPEAKLSNVQIRLTTYPSFFTTFNRRQGDRHCQTPRTDEREPKALNLVPGEDSWLLLYDTVFDVAKGEGEGPCAILAPPEGLLGGQVAIGNYAVVTVLNYRPEAGGARLGLYDFKGHTNAAAASYLKERGAADLSELQQFDFRPLAAQSLDLPKFKAELAAMLAAAGEDAAVIRPRVVELTDKLTAAGEQAASGDWQAEAALSGLLRDSDELLWKLRILALLNGQAAP